MLNTVALEVTMPAVLASMGVDLYNRNGLTVTSPVENSVMKHQPALFDAAVARAAQIAPDASPLLVDTVVADPKGGLGQQASHSKAKLPNGKEGSRITINPNANAAYYAHELGHGVAQKTKVGNFINRARHTINSNPKLGTALGYALAGGLGFGGAALQEGDDDLAASIAIAAAAASPTLVDEALATKNALAIMQDAGLRATAGQRGRLAGGYLSYLAPVLLAGSVGNALGNVADDSVALYNL